MIDDIELPLVINQLPGIIHKRIYNVTLRLEFYVLLLLNESHNLKQKRYLCALTTSYLNTHFLSSTGVNLKLIRVHDLDFSPKLMAGVVNIFCKI